MKSFELFRLEEEDKLCKMVDSITSQFPNKDANCNANYLCNALPHLIVQAIYDYEKFKMEL